MAQRGSIRRKRGLSEEVQASVYTAAMEVFAEKGLQAAKVEEVAERAGLARATLYYHFQSKRDLFIFLLKEGVRRMAAHVRSAVDKADSPTGRIEALVEGYVDFFAENRNFTQVAMLETWRLDPDFDLSPPQLLAPAIEVTADVLLEARSNGLIKDVDPEMLLSAFFGFITAAPIYYTTYRGEFPREKMREALKDLFLHGIMTGGHKPATGTRVDDLDRDSGPSPQQPSRHGDTVRSISAEPEPERTRA